MKKILVFIILISVLGMVLYKYDSVKSIFVEVTDISGKAIEGAEVRISYENRIITKVTDNKGVIQDSRIDLIKREKYFLILLLISSIILMFIEKNKKIAIFNILIGIILIPILLKIWGNGYPYKSNKIEIYKENYFKEEILIKPKYKGKIKIIKHSDLFNEKTAKENNRFINEFSELISKAIIISSRYHIGIKFNSITIQDKCLYITLENNYSEEKSDINKNLSERMYYKIRDLNNKIGDLIEIMFENNIFKKYKIEKLIVRNIYTYKDKEETLGFEMDNNFINRFNEANNEIYYLKSVLRNILFLDLKINVNGKDYEFDYFTKKKNDEFYDQDFYSKNLKIVWLLNHIFYESKTNLIYYRKKNSIKLNRNMLVIGIEKENNILPLTNEEIKKIYNTMIDFIGYSIYTEIVTRNKLNGILIEYYNKNDTLPLVVFKIDKKMIKKYQDIKLKDYKILEESIKDVKIERQE